MPQGLFALPPLARYRTCESDSTVKERAPKDRMAIYVLRPSLSTPDDPKSFRGLSVLLGPFPPEMAHDGRQGLFGGIQRLVHDREIVGFLPLLDLRAGRGEAPLDRRLVVRATRAQTALELLHRWRQHQDGGRFGV